MESHPLFGLADASTHACGTGMTSSYPRRVVSVPVPTAFELTYFAMAAEVATTLIKLVGLNPTCSTIEEMDGKDVLLLCSGCQGAAGSPVYTWRAAVRLADISTVSWVLGHSIVHIGVTHDFEPWSR